MSERVIYVDNKFMRQVGQGEIIFFNTPEQLRFNKTLLWTRIVTLILFLGLLIAISLPFLTKTESIVEKRTKNRK